jgi:hypothetical protein
VLSLFAYCTDVLRLSGDAAYGRIETARIAPRFPVVLNSARTEFVSSPRR